MFKNPEKKIVIFIFLFSFFILRKQAKKKKLRFLDLSSEITNKKIIFEFFEAFSFSVVSSILKNKNVFFIIIISSSSIFSHQCHS